MLMEIGIVLFCIWIVVALVAAIVMQGLTHKDPRTGKTEDSFFQFFLVALRWPLIFFR
jgi:hypothetical protein